MTPDEEPVDFGLDEETPPMAGTDEKPVDFGLDEETPPMAGTDEKPVDFGLDEETPPMVGPHEEPPIIVDLDQSVFDVLRRVETTMDPSDWIRAAVQEKAERDDRASHDAVAQLNGLLAEMLRIVNREQEFTGDAAIRPLSHLSARLREAEGLVNELGSILNDG